MLTEQDLRNLGYMVNDVQHVEESFGCTIRGDGLGDVTASCFSTDRCFQVALRVGLEAEVPEAKRYQLVVGFMEFNALRTLTRVSALPVFDEGGALVRRHFVLELTIDLRCTPTKEQFDAMLRQAIDDRVDVYEMYVDAVGDAVGDAVETGVA